MFRESDQGAGASNIPPTNNSPSNSPQPEYEIVHHQVWGTLHAVHNTIKHFHKLNYAEPNDWTRPLPTGRPNEVMAVLTRRVRIN